MQSFHKFYHDANRNRTGKKKVKSRKYKMINTPVTKVGIEDHKTKQNINSDPTTQNNIPSSSVYKPKG